MLGNGLSKRTWIVGLALTPALGCGSPNFSASDTNRRATNTAATTATATSGDASATRKAAVTVSPATATNVVTVAKDKPVGATTIREIEHALTETLTLGTTQSIAEPTVSIASEPLQKFTCPAQTITATTSPTYPHTVAAQAAAPQTQNYSKIGPRLGQSTPDTVAYAGKPVDIYLIIDNTSGFLEVPAKTTGMQAVVNLLTQVYDTDWHLFVGGIVTNSNGQKTTSFFKTTNGITFTPTDVQTTIPTAINTKVLTNDASDYAPLFRSLYQLQATFAGSARANAIKASFIISNATNCTVIQNGAQILSTNCAATSGATTGTDSYNTLISNSGGAADYRNSVNLFGAMYQMNANAPVCGSFFVPEANAALTHGGTQFSTLAYTLEQINYPGSVPTGAASWVGDICATTPDWSFLTRFGSAILDEATYRFVVTDNGGIFDFSGEGFPLQIVSALGGVAGAPLASSQYTLIGGPAAESYVRGMTVKITDQSVATSSPLVEATYYQDNGFRNSTYSINLLPDGTKPVSLTWANGGQLSCSQATQANPTFTSGVNCLWYQQTLYLSSTALPAVAANGTLNFTLNYTNVVQNVASLTLTTNSALLTVAPYSAITLLQSVNGGAAQAVNAVVTVNSPTSVTFTLPSGGIFPSGTYTTSYFEQNDTNGVCTLPAGTTIASGTPSAICYRSDGKPALDAAGQLTLSAGASYPCTLNGTQISYTGILTPDPATAVSVAYRTVVQSIASFTLEKLPDAGSLVIVVTQNNTPKTLASTDYSLNGKFLVLNSALSPGETMNVSYTVTVPLSTVNCLALSAVAIDGKYTVTYGVTGDEVPLDPSKFTITSPNGAAKPSLVCLAPGVADFNHSMNVAYTDTDATTSTTATP